MPPGKGDSGGISVLKDLAAIIFYEKLDLGCFFLEHRTQLVARIYWEGNLTQEKGKL